MFQKLFRERKLFILSVVMAGLCLFRILSVHAGDRVEVYSATEGRSYETKESEEESDEVGRISADIQLTRPGEAEDRIVHEDSHNLVKGADRLNPSEEIKVPVRQGRSIASDPMPNYPLPPKSIRYQNRRLDPSSYHTREAADQNEYQKENFVREYAESRSAEQFSESIGVKEIPPTGMAAYGLREPSAMRANDMSAPIPEQFLKSHKGLQEVSVIVSDYGFFPSRIIVTQNIPVKIYLTTASKSTMCFMMDRFGIKKGVTPGKIEEVAFFPETPGDFKIQCPIKSIHGTLTVKEAPVLSNISDRGLATSDDLKAEVMDIVVPADSRKYNEPKNAAELRGLIED